LNYKLPDLDIESKSDNERINSYRKFFADMRLNRLYFHILLLKFFSGENNQGDLISVLQSNIDFIHEINIWTNNLKEKGRFEEFKKICNEEINVINIIIQTYENRMKNNDQAE
jgi:hypothetical protein